MGWWLHAVVIIFFGSPAIVSVLCHALVFIKPLLHSFVMCKVVIAADTQWLDLNGIHSVLFTFSQQRQGPGSPHHRGPLTEPSHIISGCRGSLTYTPGFSLPAADAQWRACWLTGDTAASDRMAEQQVVKTAQWITGTASPLTPTSTTCTAHGIITDTTHPGLHLLVPLPSRWRFWTIQTHTSRLRIRFYPRAVKLLTPIQPNSDQQAINISRASPSPLNTVIYYIRPIL